MFGEYVLSMYNSHLYFIVSPWRSQIGWGFSFFKFTENAILWLISKSQISSCRQISESLYVFNERTLPIGEN